MISPKISSHMTGTIVSFFGEKIYKKHEDVLFKTAEALMSESISLKLFLGTKMIVNNETVGSFLKERYTSEDIFAITSLLNEHNVLDFPVHENGLFSAAILSVNDEHSGYSNVWVRDNIYIAYAHYATNKPQIAVNTVQKLMDYFKPTLSR